MTLGSINYSDLSAGQQLAVKYFVVAMVLFIAQMLFGLLSALQFIMPEFLFEVLDFNVTRMVHINAMVVWMLYGFIGSIFWLVEDEAGVPLVGVTVANVTFWILTLTVTIVVMVFLARISHNQVGNDVFYGMRGVRGMACRVASSKRLRRAGMRVFSTPFCGRFSVLLPASGSQSEHAHSTRPMAVDRARSRRSSS